MKVDTGFWNKDGKYIESIEELTMEELEEENKRLKREYDILDGIIEINNFKIAELKSENDNYRKALEGIFNLCNKNITDCENCKKQECAICNKAPGFSAKIIKIINEVLKEGE